MPENISYPLLLKTHRRVTLSLVDRSSLSALNRRQTTSRFRERALRKGAQKTGASVFYLYTLLKRTYLSILSQVSTKKLSRFYSPIMKLKMRSPASGMYSWV